VSADIDTLVDAARRLIADPVEAARAGAVARAAAGRFTLDRFLSQWDRLLWEVAAAGCRDRTHAGAAP
jgi:hypothetical protein